MAKRTLMLLAAMVLATAVAPKEGSAMEAQPGKRVLEGVPKVDFGPPRYCSFTASLEAVMQYLGDPVDYDYAMGVSGLAFRRLWNRDDHGNQFPTHFEPESVRQTFWALGYDCQIISHRQGRAAMLRALQESLAKGRPVIACGLVGPAEYEVVTGYSTGGDVLHGWSQFQDFDNWRRFTDRAIPGYYAKPNWYQGATWTDDHGFVIIGDKRPRPSKREVLLSSLKWAIEVERTAKRPGLPDHSAGLAAYAAWAKALEVDADYPKDDPKLLDGRHMILADQGIMVEERQHAARFLRQMADAAPEAADTLKAAADLYQQVSEEAGPVYPYGPNWAKPDLADPVVRHEIAKHVRTAMEKETKAVELLEKALAAMEAAPAAKPESHAPTAP